MRNTRTLLTVVGLATLLAGAGCSTTNLSPTDDSAGHDNMAIDTSIFLIDNPTDGEPTDESFSVSAALTGANTVKVTWTTPSSLDPESVIKVLYGPRPNPDFGKDYWFERSNKDLHDATIPGIKPGITHFRVCEFKDNACVRYSNEVTVDVKG